MKFRTALLASFALLATACGGKAKVTVKAPAPKPAPVVPAPEPKPEPPKVEPKKVSHIKISKDHLIIDRKIHFGNNSDEIQPDSFELLDEMAQVLKEHKEIGVLHVIGHTDSKGNHNHNMDLSKRRAASVVKYLRDKGVSQTIDSKGAGETAPTCKENTDECHEKNRRVEFLIEKKEG